MTHRQPATRASLLLGASLIGLLATPAGAQIANLRAAAGGIPSMHVPVATPRPSNPLSAAQLTGSRLAIANQARAAATYNLATQAQAAARGSVTDIHGRITVHVPNGLGAGGLDPVAHPVLATDDTTGRNTWQGALKPTQTADAAGKITVTVKQTASRAILSWETLNVGEKTTLSFDQKANGVAQKDWVALNRVVGDAKPSAILGSIKADGTVLILNRAGVIFGNNAQVNTHSLVATSLEIGRARALDGTTVRALSLAERNAEFLRYGLLGFADQASPAESATAYAFSAPAIDGERDDSTPEGAITIETGARIDSDDGGFLMFAGPKVVNEGTLSADNGQVSLQSGRRIRLTRSEGTATSADPNIRGLIVSSDAIEGDPRDYVVNGPNGVIASPRGYLSLGATTDGAVLQQGVLSASTSVSRNAFVSLTGGTISLGTGSLIWVKPDAGAETIPQAGASVAAFKTSRIEIGDASSDIEFASGSTLLAPSADVVVGAATGRTAIPSDGTGGGRIFVDSGALIDVGGVKDYVVPASRNVIKIDPVKGNELRDSPLYRATFLNGATVYVDPRLSGVRADGVRWVGSPLIEAESFYAQVGITASELMTSGGNVSLGVASYAGADPSFAPDVVVKAGAKIDISGGWVRYEGGRVQTSRLITASGAVVDIGAADPNTTYVGLVSGFTATSERWGLTEISANPILMGDRVEESFTEGRDAGSLTIKASAIAFDGTLQAQAYAGDRQTVAATPGSLRSSVFGDGRLLQGSPSDLPSGGFFYVQALGVSTVNAAQTTGGGDIRVTAGAIPSLGGLAYGQTPTIDAAGDLVLAERATAALLDPARRDTILLSDKTLSGSGLAQVSLETSGALTIEQGATVALADGGVFAGSAGRAIAIDGRIVARGGTIDLETFQIADGSVFADDPIGAGSLDITVNGTLSARGRWANDYLATDPVGGSYLDGGTVRIAVAPRVSIAKPGSTTESIDVSGSILINRGALIDVSGGGYVDAQGAIDTSARGGDLTLIDQTNYFQISPTPAEGNETPGNVPGFRVTTNPAPNAALNPSEITSRVSIADGTILAHGFAGGGTFALTTPAITLGDGSAQTGTELALDFFSTTGFADYAITSFATKLDANRFDNDLGGYNAILATQEVTIGAGETLRLTQSRFSPLIDGTQLGALQGLVTGGDLYSVLRPAVDDAAYDRLGVGLTFGGLVELHIAKGGRITGDAGSSLGASKFWNEGSVRLVGGDIVQRETLPSLYATALGITSIDQAFGVRADGSIAEDDPNALGITDDNGVVLTNAQLAATPLYLLGGLGQGEGIRLASGSVTDLSGASIRNPRSPQTPLDRTTSVVTGRLIDGGMIATASATLTPPAPLTRPGFGEGVFRSTLISLDGITPGRSFTAEAGSTIDVSGASDTYAQPMIGRLYVDRPVWSAGGAVLLAAGGTLTGATIHAAGGSPFAEGGTLTMLDPILSQRDGAGIDQISADAIAKAGFDTFVALGSLTGSGEVTLALDRGFFLQSRDYEGDSSNLAALLPTVSADGALRIDAPYIRFDSLVQSMQSPLLGTPGTGSVTFNGESIDVRGAVLFDQSIARVNLIASGDVRLIGVAPVELTLALPDTDVANSLLGQLVVNGDLAITAGRVYPTTGSRFLVASAGADATIRFAGVAGATSGAPFSAGADLLVQAAHIDQGGVVRVPIGGLTLGGNDPLIGGTSPFAPSDIGDSFAPATLSVALHPGSITSVSADGLSIPYGTTTDQIEYFFNPTGSTPLSALPEAVLRVAARDIAIENGADVDISGGGDVYAYEFIPGTGGSRDVLDRFNGDAFSSNDGFQYPDGRQIYAIVPGLSDGAGAAYDPIYSADYDPIYGAGQIGKSVYLDGGTGLKAGWYTLLPAKYAMLPGGMRVVEQPEIDAVGGARATLADGSVVTTGYYGTAGTAFRESTLRSFTVQSQSVFRQYSNIVLTSGTKTFADRAARNGVTPPRSPLDAGRIVLAPIQSLVLDAAVNSKAAKGGRGALADISGDAFRITSGASAPIDGVISLDADGLTNLAVESLLIGGTRDQLADGTTRLDVTARDISVENDAAHPLSATELLLAVDGSTSAITIADGATLTATGKPADPDASGYVIDGATEGMTGQGALVRVANGPERLLTRTHMITDTDAAMLTIGKATLTGAAVVVDSSADANLAGARIDAAAVALGASDIAFGGDAATGLTIGSGLRAQLAAADRVTLVTPGAVSFAGDSYRFGDLVLDTPTLNGLGGDVAIRADSVRFQNAGAAGTSAVDGDAKLAITAADMVFGQGPIRQTGFDGGTRLVASKGIRYDGIGGYDAGAGALAIVAPTILDAAIPIFSEDAGQKLPALTLASTGAVTIAGKAPSTAATEGTPGAKLAIRGDSVEIDGTHLRATAGVLSIDATHDIRLSEGALLDAPGYQHNFGDAADGYVVSAAGGGVALSSTDGDVVAGAGTKLSVGGGKGKAGTLSLIAQVGTVTLDGTIDAVAPGGGGSLAIDSGGAFDLDGFARKPAGFTGAIDIRTGAGNLALGAGHNLAAQSLTLVADGGGIAIDGTIDTSGKTGGDVALYGRTGVTLGSTAKIDAHASGYGTGDSRRADAGDVLLGTEDAGAIAVAQGAVIDLSASHPGDRLVRLTRNGVTYYSYVAGDRGGTLTLRAPIVAQDGADTAHVDFAGSVEGARAITLEAYKRWDLADIATDPRFSGITIEDGTAVIDLRTEADGRANFLGDLADGTVPDFIQNFDVSGAYAKLGSIGGSAVFAARPGVELVADGGITLASNWNLGAGTVDIDAAVAAGVMRPSDVLPGRFVVVAGQEGALLANYTNMLYRVGGKITGQAGAFALRAGGDLTIKGSVSDGFFTFGNQSDKDYLSAVLGASGGATDPYYNLIAVGPFEFTDIYTPDSSNVFSKLIVDLGTLLGQSGDGGGSAAVAGPLPNDIPYDAVANSAAAIGNDPFGSAALYPLIGDKAPGSSSLRLVAGAASLSVDPMRTSQALDATLSVSGERTYEYGASGGGFTTNLTLNISGLQVAFQDMLSTLQAIAPRDPSFGDNYDNAYTTLDFTTAPAVLQELFSNSSQSFFADQTDYDFIGDATTLTAVNTTGALAQAYLVSIESDLGTLIATTQSGGGGDTAPASTASVRSFVRTGTGSIQVAAAGNVDLRGGADAVYRTLDGIAATLDDGYQVGGSAIYTAGGRANTAARTAIDAATGKAIAIDPANFLLGGATDEDFASFTYGTGAQTALAGIFVATPVYADGGGDIAIDAGGDVLGRRDVWQEARVQNAGFSFIGASDQPWRTGTIGDSTNLRVNPQLFASGVGTLGGGSIAIRAGGDVSDLTLTALTSATTATATATGLTPTRALITYGGGDVSLIAGGDLVGGRFDVARGAAALHVTGGVVSAGDLNLRPDNAPGTNLFQLRLSDATVTLSAGGGIVMQGIGALGVTRPEGEGSAAFNTAGFYSPRSAVSLLANGDIAITNPRSTLTTSRGGGAIVAVYPATVDIASLTGGIALTPNNVPGLTAALVDLAPSPTGQLRLLANGDISAATIVMEDRDPGLLPGLFSSYVVDEQSQLLAGQDFGFPAVLPDTTTAERAALHDASLTHLGDAEPVRIVAGGDLDGLILSLPKQARIAAGRDIVDMMLFAQNLVAGDITRVTAGRDIIATTKLTRALLPDSGGAFGAALPALQGNTFVIGGPGAFMLEAGRDAGPFLNSANADPRRVQDGNIDFFGTLAFGGGIISLGNEWNPYLADKGADIAVLFGVAKGTAYDALRDTYLDPANVEKLDDDLFVQVTDANGNAVADRTHPIYAPILIAWLQANAADTLAARFGTQDVNYAQAYEAFTALSPLMQRRFLVSGVYFNELEATSRPDGPSYLQYSRGYQAVNTLFPAALGYTANALGGGAAGASQTIETGNLDLRIATIQTTRGGAVAILGPGGRILAGSTVRTAEQAARRSYDGGRLYQGDRPFAFGDDGNPQIGFSQTSPAVIDSIPTGLEGIITLRGGAIQSFTDGDLLLNQSRLFTEAGGDITLWSSNGDLNAGQGPRSAANFPPVVVRIDENAFSQVDAVGGVAGAGIAAFQPAAGVTPPDVFLIAPRGTVDAGDAGVRVAGNLFIAAAAVANADNFSVGGSVVGLASSPVVDAGAAAAANAASAAAQQVAEGATKANRRDDALSRISVDVQGYAGAAGDDPCDNSGPRAANCPTQ